MRYSLVLLLIFPSLCWAEASRNFNGTNDEIDMGNVLNITTGNVSVCAWWKGTEDASADFILGKRADNNAGTAGYVMRQNSADGSQFVVGDGTTSVGSGISGDTDGAWFALCGTWDGANNIAELFTNGASSGTGTDSVGSLTTTANLQFGEDSGDSTDANGLIAVGTVITGVILTSQQVQESMWHIEGQMLNGAGGLWPLWGASPEQDLSGNARTGTVVAGAAVSTDGPPTMAGAYAPI